MTTFTQWLPVGGRSRRQGVRNESGTTLLITMMALMIVALVGMVVARVASTELEITGNYRGSNRAFYAADGGAEYGLNELLELGRSKGRFPTSSEMAAILPPTLFSTNFTLFQIVADGPEVTQPLATGFYQGLVASTQPFKVTATAETNEVPVGTTTIAMTSDFDIIPIFQFAIFYEEDMEILPGPNMTLNGRVHSNANIYIGSNAVLTVDSAMTSAGDIYNKRKNDGGSMPGTVQIRDSMGVFQAMAGLDSDDPNWQTEALNRWDGNVRSQVHDITRLNLTIEDPTNPRTIIEAGRPTDTQAQQDAKIWYDADLRIVNGQGFDKLGSPVSLIDPLTSTSAVRQTVIFDQREQKNMLTTEVDMDKLNRLPGFPANGQLYVGAFQPGNGMPSWQGGASGVGPPPWAGYPTPWSGTGTTEFGIKLTNGTTLAAPLSVVSENPLYITGDYNTVNKQGASVLADAVTILSNNWGDTDGDGNFDDDLTYSQMPLGARIALPTTVNAAVMLGNTDTVPGTSYNGGVENVMRFLESWSGRAFTYRGSIIDLWNSVYATGTWIYGTPVYRAPIRDFGFDTAFLTPANLPPGTPNVYTIRVIGWDRQ
ncbi:MAG: PilX N-terminal domain-containing pilus assembly protein [Acidobacteriota bacterium]